MWANNINGEIKVLEANRRNTLTNIKKVEELEGKYANLKLSDRLFSKSFNCLAMVLSPTP